ncbi:hypothetical protein [Spirosoma agri]|uniref:Viral A-type inclusion protein n=1 Tax=Spirosoma agri TaxID=1987381 RepID=A0A6M0ISC2_9BACT|nr:hypothetical protein [Spirosoma agri]NEU70321.1 hypothetical protein [Spirosoma agri]
MLNIHFLVSSLLWLFVAGCQSNQHADTTTHSHSHSAASTADKPAAVASLEKDVLAVHDSLMPQMSELMRLQKALKTRLTDLNSQPPSAALTQQKEQGLAVSLALVKTDNAMMDWMHGYNGDTLAKLDQSKALAYLKDQQQKVNALRQMMQQHIADAKTYLK